MRVKDLIEALQKFPGDALVETEGCDCNGLAGPVVMDRGMAQITRLPTCTCEDTDDEGDAIQVNCHSVLNGCDCKRCHPPGSVYP